VAKFSYSLLTSWYTHRSDLYRWRVVDYYLYRAEANLRLMSRLDLINKTCEFARVYGIEFYHVLSRGSQYRVESMMLRVARKLNYVALSATPKQKAQMRAPDCIPLTLEPESGFYTAPMAVLDFQSLYPSVIIAHNICFTTCLGRVEQIGKEGCFKFGCSSLFLSDELLKSLDMRNDIYVAPNGVAFVKPHIRKGILPIMLDDILRTRVMVKNSMKLHKSAKAAASNSNSNESLLKVLDSRQLSLKLIANVTFGYTAANYSGRMPCVEVGDTIVRVARHTLENSIKHIETNRAKYGGCRVVYGDTDSIFVLFEKSSKPEAFEWAYKIVDDISDMNVKPMKLKFEKIYMPSILLAKKRYCGYMYETPQQLEPVLDTKGTEIIRRDGCQVAAKVLERAIKVLFELKDVAKVRDYVARQCGKIVNGKVNLKEFIIAKEYRGRDSYENVKSVAACQIANKALIKDPLAEPLAGERVPYVLVYGTPGLPLYELVRSPEELINNTELRLNYEYYVMKQIMPPLDRVMVLLNENVYEWIKGVSFKQRLFQYYFNHNSSNQEAKGGHKDGHQDLALARHTAAISMTKYVYSTDCVLCGKRRNANALDKSKQGLCVKCSRLSQANLTKLRIRFQKSERRLFSLARICQMCTSNQNLNGILKGECCSLDCPNNFMLINAKQEHKKTDYVRKIVDEFF
jgi:DNA polymerase zeta